jgi:hypothetical protein
LRIGCLGLCRFKAWSVDAGCANERREGRCIRKCPSCAWTHGGGYKHNAPCIARTSVWWKPLRNEAKWLCLEDSQAGFAPQVEWMRRRCGCRCASPVPHQLAAQHGARELCLEVLRLHQTRQSMGWWTPACLDHVGGRCHWPRGAGLGRGVDVTVCERATY